MSELTEAGHDGQGLLELAALVLAEKGFETVRVPGRAVLRFVWVGPETTVEGFLQERADARQLCCYTVAPMRCPLARRPAMCVLTVLANYGLPVGALELDLVDGEVRFRTSADLFGTAPAPGIIRNALEGNLASMGRLLPAIEAVIVGGDPEAALRAVGG